MSENDHAYELRELMENFVQGFGAMGEAARKALEGLELTGQPVPKQPEPDRFKHTDGVGDRLSVGPNQYGVLVVSQDDDMPVHLDQDAVNRLAQYLDRHRTDTPCPTRFYDEDCAGTRGHDGVCDPDADNLGAPVNVRGNCLACGHHAHGSVQCGAHVSGPVRCLCRGGSDGA